MNNKISIEFEKNLEQINRKREKKILKNTAEFRILKRGADCETRMEYLAKDSCCASRGGKPHIT